MTKPARAFTEMTAVGVEHGFGSAGHKGFVVVRVEHSGGIVITQISPDEARDLAGNLMEVAARADYEQDLWRGLGVMPDKLKGAILVAARDGERTRHTSIKGTDGNG